MKKNKFNIGQIVIVIDGKKIKEKQVLEIDGTGDEISYELGDPPAKKTTVKAHFCDVFAREYMQDPVFGRSGLMEAFPPRGRGIRNASKPPVLVFDDLDSDTYLESEIFTTEDEFRKTVTIEKYPIEKTKAERLAEFKDAVSKISNDDTHKIESLVKEFQTIK